MYDSARAVSQCSPELASLAIALAKGIGISLYLSPLVTLTNNPVARAAPRQLRSELRHAVFWQPRMMIAF
ncbi:hypothetical protein [Streptomyces sp. NBC_01236]|uniref:hypothetical protein n=1 Tax=Streptomyces sp. NBC_01236 TaxID=2903789 RepID=UPI002E0E1712|nr:hypothetical protein OG324_06895 [Streptomyces sp. NBC_01236]